MVKRAKAITTISMFLVAVLGISCSQNVGPPYSPDLSFFVGIANIDGPPIEIWVNERLVATASCQLDGAAGFELRPSAEMPLPWTISVFDNRGLKLGSWTEDGEDGPKQLLIRGSVAYYQSTSSGGGPRPIGTCFS